MNQSKPLLPDTFFVIARESVAQNGEDSYCYSFGQSAALLAVFDGCGGSGARKHAYFSNKTEAYMASRMCAGAFYDGFQAMFPQSTEPMKLVSDYIDDVSRRWDYLISRYSPPKETGRTGLRSNMIQSMPTTAAAMLLQNDPAQTGILASALWAGDSRVYLMDESGLAQLSQDDSKVRDPMENLYDDGIMTKTITGEKGVRLNTKTVKLSRPFIALTATDGCFAYLSTPMEFEGIILESLAESANTAQWQKSLTEKIERVKGDDFTLCLAAYGYRDYQQLRAAYLPRYQQLCSRYLDALKQMPAGKIEERRKLWQTYRIGYMRYIEGE